MNNTILLHNAAIEFFILILIVILYYSKTIPKEYMTICLLGSYILMKSAIGFIHYGYHQSIDKAQKKLE